MVFSLSLAAAATVVLVLSGCSTKWYRRSADKEAYAAIRQKQAAVTNMDPHFTLAQTNVLDLTGLPELTQTNDFLGPAAAAERGAKLLTLEHALGLAVKLSRVYQNSKEQLYLTALGLTQSRHLFTPIFSAGGNSSYLEEKESFGRPRTNEVTGQIELVTSDTVARRVRASGSAGVDWLIRDIGRLSVGFTTDFLRLLSGGPSTIISSQVGATFTRPLLRNAGYKAEVENLTQAERDLLYAIRDFVRFRKDFSVQIASSYYGVLGNRDAARNSYLNLQGSKKAGDRTRALAAEGRTTQTDLGRIEQQELSAESAWIAAVRVYQRALDDFKIQLGVPVETRLVLDDSELRNLTILQPNITVDEAIRIALAARLDYQNTQDAREDAERKVKLAIDRLKPQLDFVANGGLRSRTENKGFPLPDPDLYYWNVGGNFDPGLDRKFERNAYRSSLIAVERSRRDAELLRDQIEMQVRESWRTLEQARRTYQISEIGVNLAQRRVEEQELLAELGRAKALDQVDAQNALLASTDQRTQALVAHTIARLQFWDNMGILYIKDDGQWEEGAVTAVESDAK